MATLDQPIDPSSVSFRGFSTSNAPVFPHDTYSFLMASLREQDATEGEELLLRWLASEQSEFEDTYARIKTLLTFPDPEICPAEALPYLRWIVGLTAKLDGVIGDISEADLRRLISVAVRMWKLKGTEKGLANTLRALTTRTARILNWFFFRIILGEAELGRAELSVDPWLLDELGMQTSILPDSVITGGPYLRGDVLPSADTPAWTYVSEGESEGTIFAVSGEALFQFQSFGNAFGGRYYLDAPLDASTAEIGAIWTALDLTEVGGRPFRLFLEDGSRGYVLSWSDTEVALESVSGSVIVSPRSRGFSVGNSYRMRLYKDGAGSVRASADGVDLFGEVSSALFPVSVNSRYGFGYLNLGENQTWTVTWDDVGPLPELTLNLTTLLGATEAVPHRIRVKHVPSKSVRTVYSYWDGSSNLCRVLDAFGNGAPFTVSQNDLRVGVDPDEYVSDVRIVDDGTGTLDRNLIEGIMSTLRPSGERYFLRYLDFSDEFRRTFDWIAVSGTAVPSLEEGLVTLGDPTFETVIKTDYPNDATWEQPQLVAQFSLKDPTSWGEVRFNYQDEFNFYAMRLDAAGKQVLLDRMLGGVRTNLSTVGILVFHPEVNYYLHVHVENSVTPGTLVINFHLDGNLLGTVIDAGGSTSGKLAVAAGIGQELKLTFSEMFQLPLDSVRIGPP